MSWRASIRARHARRILHWAFRWGNRCNSRMCTADRESRVARCASLAAAWTCGPRAAV